MANLPLYDILLTQVKHLDIDLTIEEKKECCNMITTLDTQGCENIYLLMRVHNIKDQGDINLFTTPYGGVEVTKQASCADLKFNLDNLPITLKHMIYKFCKIHIQKMKEESERDDEIVFE